MFFYGKTEELYNIFFFLHLSYQNNMFNISETELQIEMLHEIQEPKAKRRKY